MAEHIACFNTHVNVEQHAPAQPNSACRIPHMTPLANRIKQRIEQLGTSARAVSIQVTGKGEFLRPILNEGAQPRANNLARLAEVLGVSIHWLLTGEQEHLSSEEVAAGLPAKEQREDLATSSLENYSGKVPGAVPEIDAKAGAGNGNVGEHEVVTLRRGETYVGHKVVSEWVFPSTYLRHELRMQPGDIMVLEVVGDSMSPTLESGDRVMVDTTYSKPTPDGIYVIEEGDGPMVKRLQLIRRSDPPEIRIISDNKHHEPYTLRLEDIRIIGRVSGRVTKM